MTDGAGPLRDAALGLGLGLVVAASPLTPHGPLAAVFGAAAGGGLFAWRLLGRRRAADAETEAAEATTQAPRTPLSVWAVLLLIAAVFTPTGLYLYDSWTGSVWNNAHGILIPPIMAWMTWTALRGEEDRSPDASAWGFAFLVPGLLLVALDSALRTQQVAAVGLVLALVGLALLLLGARRTRLLNVALLLGVFMIPIRNSVASHLALRQITAVGAEPLLDLMGVPVIRHETLLVLSNASFLVADACSGFSTLYAAVGISVVLAAYARSWPRRVLLLVAAWPLAIACNIARVTILVVVANTYGLDLLDTPFHAASGIATFWAVLVLLIMMSDRDSLRKAST